jgi:AcrR family transcriptional regulator
MRTMYAYPEPCAYAVRCQAVPRPRSLTHDKIASAALSVLDREGPGALSMRSVAGELGVGTMSLYRYVDGKEQLETLVVDRVLGAVDLEVPARARWTRCVSLLAERARRAIADHPSIVPLVLLRRHSCEASLCWGEAVLRALSDGGFTGKRRALAFRTLLSYVLGAVQVEHFGALAGRGTVAIAELPRARFPNLAETARHAQRIPEVDEFKSGLSAVLRGLEELR